MNGHSFDEDELFDHSRGVLLEVAAELRRLQTRLADLSTRLPSPETVEVIDRGQVQRELAAVQTRPPTVLEAQLGALEMVVEQLGESVAQLQGAAEVSTERLAERWHEHQAADHLAEAARLSRSGHRDER